MDEQAFRFWVALDPLSKSEAASSRHTRPIQGFASTDDEDLQREIVVQQGLDTAPFLTKGFIDWDHMGRHGIQYMIGEPISAEIVRIPGRGEGLFIKGFLYEDNPISDAAWAQLQRVEKGESNRPLGFSVEGAVVAREGKFIRKAIVRHTALTAQPINTFTYAQLAKSLTAGTLPDDMGLDCSECRKSLLTHLMGHKGWPAAQATHTILQLSRRGLY